MSDPSIFGNTNNGSDQNQNNPAGNSNTGSQSNNAFADLLGGIRNDNGEPKYKSVEDALKALQHSQTFIEQLKREKQEAEAAANTFKTQAEKVSELESTLQKLIQGQSQAPATTQPKQLDESAIAALVEDTLAKKQTEAVKAQNTSTVVKKLAEVFGGKAEETFYAKAAELGLSQAEMNEMAAKSPAAVFRILGIGDNATKPNTSAPATSTVNTAGFTGTANTNVRASKGVLVGATTSQVMEEHRAAKAMVDELHASGMTVYDLTDPKKFFSTMKR